MLAHHLDTATRSPRLRALIRVRLFRLLTGKRTARKAEARLRAVREHTMANAVDWAVAYERHQNGPGYVLTPEDVQLRAWADFNLEVTREEAARAIALYAPR